MLNDFPVTPIANFHNFRGRGSGEHDGHHLTTTMHADHLGGIFSVVHGVAETVDEPILIMSAINLARSPTKTVKFAIITGAQNLIADYCHGRRAGAPATIAVTARAIIFP